MIMAEEPTQPTEQTLTTTLEDEKSKPQTEAEIAERRSIEVRALIKSLIAPQNPPISAKERAAAVDILVEELLKQEEIYFEKMPKAVPNNLTAKKINGIREALLDSIANAGKERIWDINDRNDAQAAKDIFKKWERARPAEIMAKTENEKRVPHQEAVKIESYIARARLKILVMEHNLDQATLTEFGNYIKTAEGASPGTSLQKIEETLAPIFLKAQELAPDKPQDVKKQSAVPKTQEAESSIRGKTLPKNRWAYLKQFAQAWDENNNRFIPSGKKIAKGAAFTIGVAGIIAVVDAGSHSLELVDKSADAIVDNAEIIGIAAGSLVGLYFLARTLNAIYEVYKSSQPTTTQENSVSAQKTEENEFFEDNGPTEEDQLPTPP